MIDTRALAKAVTHALILAVLVSPIVLPRVLAGSAQFISVEWYPHFVTPYDNVTVRVNVTSAVGINSVYIYYRISSSHLRFNSTSDYTKERMLPLYDGIWAYDFDRQANGTTIFFFISAVDSNGAETTWPGNDSDFRSPREITVAYPGKPYLASIYIYLNQLFLSDLVQQANITVSVSGYLPSFPDPYYRVLDVRSNGPYGNRFGFFEIFEDANSRFWYSGKSSGLMDLKGSPEQVPYDTYTLNLNLTIPYRFDNLSRVMSSTPFVIFSSNDIWNNWNVPQPTIIPYSIGNDTDLILSTTLSRRVPIYYPPLVLMLVAFAVLGLIPLVSTYHPGKRFDLFLNAIILASSAELSQTFYPAGGFLGNNVFLQSFSFILVSAVFMMGVSSLPSKVRTWSRYELPLEFFTTIGIVLLAWTFILPTNFPWIAKVVVIPLAGGSGSILLMLSIYLPKLYARVRHRLRTSRKRQPASAIRKPVNKSNRYANVAFTAFGIAIGYATGFAPELNMWALAIGLTACAIAYLVITLHSHNQNLWWDYGVPTLILVIAAITPLTLKILGAVWFLVFISIGSVGMALDIKMKR